MTWLIKKRIIYTTVGLLANIYHFRHVTVSKFTKNLNMDDAILVNKLAVSSPVFMKLSVIIIYF